MQSHGRLWQEGISDAIGFVAGALLGFWLGQWVGLDVFEPGYGVASLGGIVLVGLGAGLGRRLMRNWRESRSQSDDDAPLGP
jgi:hypothetical protein